MYSGWRVLVVGRFARVPALVSGWLLAACSNPTGVADAGDPYANLRNHAGCNLGGTGLLDREAGVATCSVFQPIGAWCSPATAGMEGRCVAVRTLGSAANEYARSRMILNVCLEDGGRLPSCIPDDGGFACPGELTCVGPGSVPGAGGLCVPLPCNR